MCLYIQKTLVNMSFLAQRIVLIGLKKKEFADIYFTPVLS